MPWSGAVRSAARFVHAPRSTGRWPSPPRCSWPAGSRSTPPASAAPAPWTGRRPGCPRTARRRPPGACRAPARPPIASSGSLDDERPDPRQQPRLAEFGVPQPCVSARKARAWLRWRPKPLMMRMPSTHSSTTVVRSPSWSCAAGAPRDVPRLEDRAQHHQRHHGRRAAPGPASTLGQQDAAADQDGGRVDQQEGQREGQEHAQQLQVRGAPGQQLARGPAVVEGHRQPLQMPVEVGAHRRLDPASGRATSQRRSPNSSASATPSSSSTRRRATRRPGRARATGPVHHPLEHQRDHQADAGGEHRHEGGREQPHPHRPDVRPQAQQRAHCGALR